MSKNITSPQVKPGAYVLVRDGLRVIEVTDDGRVVRGDQGVVFEANAIVNEIAKKLSQGLFTVRKIAHRGMESTTVASSKGGVNSEVDLGDYTQ